MPSFRLAAERSTARTTGLVTGYKLIQQLASWPGMICA
jgi:hypothetical protein